MDGLILRDYQVEAIQSIPESGRYLLQMATGLGKTVVFSQLPRRGRMLILSHREELVNQPRKYFQCSYGIEQGDLISNGEEIISASVQSMHRRLNRFKEDDFDIVVVDECHHVAGDTYQKIVNHFKPRLLLGFTATPNRSDGIGLDKTFDKIIFERDLEWGIRNNHLSNIKCYRANVGFNLSTIKTRLGDFDSKELDKEMTERKTVKAVAEVYNKYAVGQTVIFCCSVNHSEEVAKEIGCVSVTGKTEERSEILEKFKRKEIRCLTNCIVFTEGTDLPCIETIIMARPTKSKVLYVQAIGRGTRTYEGKKFLTLIDCVGVTGRHNLCTAPTLIGLDTDAVRNPDMIEGDLFTLPSLILSESDVPESWIKNVKLVELFAKEREYVLHSVNYFKMPDTTMIVMLPDHKWVKITPIDKLGHASVITYDGKRKVDIKAQECFDTVFKYLSQNFQDAAPIWNLVIAKRWGSGDASDKQKFVINKRLPSFNTEGLSKLEAGAILNRLFYRSDK